MSQKGSPHFPNFVVPDAIEPVVGWKAWNVWNWGMLRSPGYQQIWKPGEAAQAICASPVWSDDPVHQEWMRTRHPSPSHDCTCGIHFAKTAYHASQYGSVIGKVYGWGRVIEHSHGWRVAYAYPAELYMRTSHPERYSALGEYGVPIKILNILEWRELLVEGAEEAAAIHWMPLRPSRIRLTGNEDDD